MVDGSAPLSRQSRARDAARRWRAWLDDLEVRLDEGKIPRLADWLATTPFDMVYEDVLRRNRSALIDEIQKAKAYFMRLAG